MAEQPPYQPGFPEQKYFFEDEQPQPVVVQPVAAPPSPQSVYVGPPDRDEERNVIDGIWSCGAGCIKYSVDDVLTEPKRRRRFISWIFGSLIAQFTFIWVLVFIMQRPNLLGDDFEKEKNKTLQKIYEKQHSAGDKVMNETGSDLELWRAMPFFPLILYFAIIIGIFRCCNCGRKPPVNWIFVVLAYLCLVATCILLIFTVPYLHVMIAGGLVSLFATYAWLASCIDLMQNAWNGYVFALISSFVCGSISTGWYYLGGFEFLVGGQDLEEAKHLATDMGAVPGVVIMAYCTLMPQYFVHELRQVLRGRRFEVKEDEACIISCIM